MATLVSTIGVLACLCGLPPREDVASEQVDLVEVNHFYDDQGRHVFDQVIFYDWAEGHSRHMVRDWRLVKNPAQLPQRNWKDGSYTGWGTSRHGDIQATVVVEAGRIVSATISQCLTRYSCSWIAALPPQVVSRQSPETDYVSGATQSTNAFYYAVVEALAKAK